MKSYRSDWPEIGLEASLIEGPQDACTAHEDPLRIVVSRELERGVHARLLSTINELETRLYPFPCFELVMTAGIEGPLNDPQRRVLTEWATDSVNGLLARLPASTPYVYSKVVAGEPLHSALLKAGFTPVEHRCLFRCEIGDLASSTIDEARYGIDFVTLTQLPPELREMYRQQILDICSEAFRTGYSRHFQDPALSRAAPGSEYISALMKTNFVNVPSSGIILAVHASTSQLWGFSVVGRKSRLVDRTYTQLLSAVRPVYHHRGVYRGLTARIAEFFPPDAILLNVTHKQSTALQNAYRSSRKKHLADTVVLRRLGT